MQGNPYAIRPTRVSLAVTLALASFMASPTVHAQDTAPPAPAAAAQGNRDVDPTIQTVVVSTRKSQQSSINRKKGAATALDSIVAEDVGALPDRNIGEAISRMSGIALDRGDFGEGVTVAVRGNGPELTRVEIDGQGVQSAGGTDMNGGGAGRGTEFRQLSSDLIKSVDVVKGSTADMTEGSLGGGVIIKTRTGLDFKEPFVSVRVAGSQNSLNKKWEPDLNVILSRKFLDNRLGVILNASKATEANEAHQIQPATSGSQGYARLIDFDNSPNKTFAYNPGTLNMLDPNSTLPTATYPTTTGAGKYATATPLEILTKSAAANTKADCYTAFPQLTTAAPTLANLASSDRTAAVNVRTNELATCLNQWNDYTPSLIRNVIRREIDKREDLDLRADFKVNNELTVYAKGSYNKRRIDNNQLTYGLGGLNVNTAGTFVDTNGVRGVAPAASANYFPYAGSYTIVANQPLVSGAVANVNPASVTVDSTHHVTQFTITDGAANTDQVHSIAETTAKYLQLGGTWRHDALTAEFFVADSKSDFTREDKRTSFNLPYGTATLSVLPSGLWSYAFPANTTLNQSNPAGYVYLVPGAASSAVAASAANINSIPAYSAGQQPQYTQSAQVTYTPQIRGTEEKTAKLDLTYALSDQIPFLQRLKTGFNLRDTSYKAWGGGGVTISAAQGTFGTANYVPPVIVPAALVRSFFQGCQDTPGSLAPGGNKCPSGYVQSNSYSTANSGTVYMTPAQFQSIIAASLSGNATATSFFNGAKGAPSGLVSNWTQIDVDKALTLTGAPNLNMNCVITCKANDGKVYEQPVSKIKERTDAFYLMGDYNIDRVPFTQRSLPFGWELEGNIGWRYVRTKVNGIGAMAFTSITRTGAYDPNNPNAAAGISTVTVTSNTPVNATVHDFLPVYNAALWVVPDQVVLRYNRARTIARPPVTYLLPAGTCTYDERLGSGSGANDVDQRCSGTIGNPLLQAQKNLNQNWSAEYYPGKDTMLSLAYFKQKGIVGPALTQGVSGGSLLGGSSVTDANGKALNDLKFDYTTYINGVPTTRKGWEFGAKTAFTFLPSYLRFTGLDANYTRLASVTSTQNVVDLLSGEPLPPLRESKSSYNWALWYDDGKLQMRVAVQGVDRFFQCIAACTANTVNNYPNAYGNQRALPWNPGSPNFRDATRFVDAKVSYKINQNFEVFLEGRNLGKATTSDSQGQYVPFASGTPSILAYNYAGRRIMAGLNFRYGG